MKVFVSNTIPSSFVMWGLIWGCGISGIIAMQRVWFLIEL